LKGLLSNLGRKTTERIALEFAENVRDLQHCVGQSPWGIISIIRGAASLNSRTPPGVVPQRVAG